MRKRGRPPKVKNQGDAEAFSDLMDPTALEGREPGKVYRFVTETGNALARAKAKGYHAVKRTEDGVKAPFLDHGRPDGFVGHDGLILMEADKTRVAARQKAAHKANKVRARQAFESELEQGLRAGEITEQQANKLAGQYQEIHE